MIAQRESFDVVSYTPPKDWSRELKKGIATTYSNTNKISNTWCQLIVYKSRESKGSLSSDFNFDWQQLIVKNYLAKESPAVSSASAINGWEHRFGSGPFNFNNVSSSALLHTFTGYGKSISVVAITNSDTYKSIIDQFFDSIDIRKP